MASSREGEGSRFSLWLPGGEVAEVYPTGL
jgi:hypothetical protein